MKLIAHWAKDKDSSIELPQRVVWQDGSPATMDDYFRHMVDTHAYEETESGLRLIMFPEIVGEVVFNREAKTWELIGQGIPHTSLELEDPEATDDEIIAELYTFPVVYRAVIRRETIEG